MTFLPIVERELRIAARRHHTYWTRFFAALLTLAVCTWVWGWLADGLPAYQRGQILFQVISGLAFLYSLVAGITITADSLSEEKREGTLGLLFLTDLKGYDVVFGKLAATSLNALYRLFSVFPILAIPLLLGALTLGEFWRMALVLTNTLFFSLSAGMVVSAVAVRERVAMAVTLLLILVITAAPPLVGLVLAFKHRSPTYPREYLLSSAVYPSVLAFDAHYKMAPKHFWAAVATTHVLGWAFLVAASFLVQRTWQDRPAAGRKAVWLEGWHNWRFGHGPALAAYRRRLLNWNPVLWLSGRDRMRPVYLVTGVLGVGLAWTWFYWRFGKSVLDPTFYFLTAYSLHTVFKLWLAAEACRPLSEDRQTGALELILSTSLSVKQLLEGHILALERHFAWPVLFILGADIVMLLLGSSTDVSNEWLFLCLGIILLFLADLYTLAWTGLWLSLVSKKPSRAVIGTIGRVLVLPWAILVLGLTLLATLQSLFSSPWQNVEPGELGLLSAAFTVAFLVDIAFFAWAKTNLHQRFRLVATQRFDSHTAPPLGPVPDDQSAKMLPLPGMAEQQNTK